MAAKRESSETSEVIESGFTTAVNKKLPKEIYIWKVSDKFTGGVPDCYYSSNIRDIWIEFKYLKKMIKNPKPGLRPLQKKWLNDRHAQGRDVYVVVGSPEGNVVYEDGDWNEAKPSAGMLTRNELVQWIKDKLCKP